MQPLDLVGRERELRVLRAGLAAARAGHGRLALVSGEPGVGKTRLARAAADEAAAAGMETVWSACWAGSGAPALWPWIQVVRALAAGRDEACLAAAAGGAAEDLARLVPEVATRLGLTVEAMPPGQSAFRILDAVAGFVLAANTPSTPGAQRPLLLVLDDLQWADATSLQVLGLLAGRLAQTRVLVLGTYRDGEIGPDHPLRALRDGLTSGHDQMRLAGLDEAAVARLVAELGQPPEVTSAAELHRRTGGNPFFVRELLQLGEPGGGAVPPGVREAIGQRLDRRSAGCRAVLEAAAVLGEQFDVDVLRAMQPGADQVEDPLAEARAANLVEGPREAPRFVHALVREVLLDGGSAAARRQLHRRAAEATARTRPGDEAALADHLLQAVPEVPAADAVRVALRVAATAMSQLAHPEAAEVLQRAADVTHRHCHDVPALRAEVLLRLGEARQAGGEVVLARRTLAAAADAAASAGAWELTADAALGFGAEFMSGTTDHTEVRLLEQALAAAPPADSRRRARLTARLARALLFTPDLTTRQGLADEAVAMAARLGDPGTLASVLSDRLQAVWGLSPLAERLAVVRDAARWATEAGDHALALTAELMHVGLLVELAELDAARAHLARVGEAVETLRQPQFRWQVILVGAVLDSYAGGFAGATADLDRAVALARRDGHPGAEPFYAASVACVQMAQGRADFVPMMESGLLRYPDLPAWRAGLAAGLCLAGRTEEAREHVDMLAADDFAALPHDPFRLAALGMLAHACHALGDAARAERIAPLLAPSSGHLLRLSRIGTAFGPVDLALGLLAMTRRQFDEAVHRLAAAAALCARIGYTPYRAHAQHHLAQALLARGGPDDPRAAQAHLQEARATADRLGIRLPGAPAATPYAMTGTGQDWTLVHRGAPVRLRGTVGLAYLARLLAEPGREFAAADLAGASSSGLAERDCGPALDAEAKAAYRRRLRELDAAIEDANRQGDAALDARLAAERSALVAALSAAVGLGGRDRPTGSAAERARTSVTKALKAAISRIAEDDPDLGAHLRRTVRTGAFCSYVGEQPWQVDAGRA